MSLPFLVVTPRPRPELPATQRARRVRRSAMGNGQEGYWRKQIIAEVLARMREEEAAEPGKPYATVLVLRQSRPKATIEDLAREFSIQSGSPVSPQAFRKALQRARRRFFALLI